MNAQLERVGIAVMPGLASDEVRRWLAAEDEADRRKSLRTSAVALAVTVLGAGSVLLFAPEGWGDAPIPDWTVPALGVCVIAMGALDLLAQLRVRLWRPTNCRILATSIKRKNRVWVPVVFYEYAAGRHTYRGSQVRLAWRPYSGNPETAESHQRRFSPGEHRRCFYDPRRPERAVLELELSYHDAKVLIGLGVLILLGGLLFGSG